MIKYIKYEFNCNDICIKLVQKLTVKYFCSGLKINKVRGFLLTHVLCHTLYILSDHGTIFCPELKCINSHSLSYKTWTFQKKRLSFSFRSHLACRQYGILCNWLFKPLSLLSSSNIFCCTCKQHLKNHIFGDK